MEQKLPPIKYAVCVGVLSALANDPEVTVEEHGRVHAYLTEALNEVISIGDVKHVITDAGIKTFLAKGLSEIVHKSRSNEGSKFLQIRSRHELAFNIIQEHLLLNLIEG